MQKNRRLEPLKAASALVAASIFCSLLAQRSLTPQSEVASEILCWTILLLLPQAGSWLDTSALEISGASNLRPTPFKSLWAIAAGLTMSCVFKAENGMVELLPLATPLLLIAQRGLGFQVEVPASTRLWPVPASIWATTLCALVVTVSVSRWGLLGSTLSIFAVICQLYVYIAFLPKDDHPSRQLPPLVNSRANAVTDLAWRAVVLLLGGFSIQSMIFGFDALHITHVLLGGVAKAMSWILILQTRRHVPWCIAPTIQSFVLITAQDPFTQSSDARAVFNVVASAVVLSQVIRMLPKHTKAKSALWIFLLASLVPYLANVLAIRSLQSATRQSFAGSHQHPVEQLVNNAKISFESLVQRQSKTYTAACDEYRRRYTMEPPPGFEEWYKFATAHQSPLIDDFDTIYNSVSPFWKLSGKEVLQIMHQAQADRSSELWMCVYSHRGATTRCRHPRRSFDRHIASTFDRLLGNLSLPLPDMKFLVNHLDEPRVLIPPHVPKSGKGLRDRLFTLTDLSHQPTWDALTKYCTSQQPDAKSRAAHTVETYGLPFVTNISAATDLCQHPEFENLHGLLIRPTSFKLVEGRVPILSTGSLSTMGDILYPSPAYFESEFQYDAARDVPWEAKQNNLYWAGSTTGGYASDDNDQWRDYHRQRFVSLAQNLHLHPKQKQKQKPYTYLHSATPSTPTLNPSTFLNRRLFPVTFTRIFQCSTAACRSQKIFYTTAPWSPAHLPLHSRLAFDIDGNGISGRFYALLASTSLPLKHTILREWHDDRLVPWAHYIPVSQGMEELPELVAYLVYHDTGQRLAREVAERGREWVGRALREVDARVYVWRLLLEVARLQDLGREGRG